MKKIGLRAKLLLSILPIVLGGIVTGGVVNYLVSSNNIQEQQILNSSLAADQVDRALTMWLSNREREARIISSRHVFQQACSGGTMELAQQKIDELQSFSPFYEAVWLSDPQGRIFLDSIGGKARNLEVAGLASFKANIEHSARGEMYMSQAGKSPASGRPVVLLTAPVKAGGKVAGIMGFSLELKNFSDDFLSTIRIGQKGYAWMTDAQGMMLAHPNKDMIFNLKLEDQSFGREIMNKKNGHLFYEWEGLDKIAFFRTNQKNGWITVLSPVPEEYLAPIQKVKFWAWSVGLATGFLVFLVIWLVIGHVVKAIYSIKSSTETMAQGDLSQRVKNSRSDEIGQLAQSLNRMADCLEEKAELADKIASGDISRNVELVSGKDHLGLALQTMVEGLNQMVLSIKDSVAVVASGSNQLAQSSQAQSMAATEQAASLEEITSSMSGLGSQTRTNAEIASQARQLTSGVRQAADKSNEQMLEMVGAMNEIAGSSKEIAKIIKAIDDIAFQTNLLALNAAVEAARAGKHGKGFAVVAQEVRSLAGRSARAAQETAELIDSSLKNVENGTEIVNRAADSLLEIVDSSTKMTALISEIADASQEQAEGIAQINRGLGQIETVTQQYTANAEETAASSEELSNQAVQLRELVSRFKAKGSNGHHPGGPTAPDFAASKKLVHAHAGGGWNEPEKVLDSSRLITFDEKNISKH